MNIRLLLSATLLMGLLFSCGNGNEGPEKPNWKDPEPETPAGQLVDSSQFGEILGDSGRISLPAEHRQVADLLFGEKYSLDKIDPMEKVPVFREARKSVFKKYLKKEYISNDYGGKIFPRHILKAWEFESAELARQTLKTWLNGQEHSDPDEIELGEDVDALKSPPFMAALRNQRIFILSSACVYSGESWQALSRSFADYFLEKEAEFVFEVNCQAGQLKYLK